MNLKRVVSGDKDANGLELIALCHGFCAGHFFERVLLLQRLQPLRLV